jgi:hypothetical protein
MGKNLDTYHQVSRHIVLPYLGTCMVLIDSRFVKLRRIFQEPAMFLQALPNAECGLNLSQV